MALLNIFKPKWQSPDPTIRLKAVSGLPPDAGQLETLILTDSDRYVRQAALMKITDCDHLRSLLTAATDDTVRQEINTHLEQLLLHTLTAAQSEQEKEEALAQITSTELLTGVAVSEDNRHIRLLAVQKIHDEQILSGIIEQDCGREPALAALAQIEDESLLNRAAQHANNRAVRARAADRLAALTAARHQTTPTELRNEQLSALLTDTAKITTAADPEKAWQEFTEITKSWERLAPPPDHILVQEFNKLQDKIKERYEAFISFDKEKKARFIARDASLRHLEDIALAIKELAGSTAVSSDAEFKKLQDEWQEIAIPDLEIPPKLHDKYSQICRNFTDNQQIIAGERDLLANFDKELKAIAGQLPDDDSKFIRSKKSNQQQDYLRQTIKSINKFTAKIKEWEPLFLDKSEIMQRLNALKDEAEQKRQHLKEEMARQWQDNQDTRLAILSELRAMITAPDVENSTKKLPEIKEKWEKLLKAPLTRPQSSTEATPNLSEQFNELIDKFRSIQDDFFRVRDWQLWQNKTLKDALIRQVQELETENDLHLVFKKLKQAQQKWREIGPVPPQENNKLWSTFKKAADHNFSRCQTFFRELDEIAAANLGKKMALCRAAQELQDSDQWRKTTDKFKSLQQEWREAGRAPKDREDEAYTIFRQACDHFFARRQDYYQEQDKIRLANLSQKEDLCRQVEELSAAPQLEHKKTIQSIQQQWKKIGQAPKDKNDEIWQRFRKACDTFFQWLDSLKPENLANKEILCEQAENIVAPITKADHGSTAPRLKFQDMAKEIKNLQEQWRTIGPAPADRQEEIWQRFKKACDVFYNARHEHFDKIDRQRPANEYLKEKVLARIQQLTQTKAKGAIKEIISLQEEWPHIGQANRQREPILQRQFKEICNNFFKNRREAFQELDNIRRDNLKQKEALCLRLELLTGINHTNKVKAGPDDQSLTLAEQLKLAFESNFIMAGAEKNSRRKKDEFELISQEWQKIGPVPKEHEHAIKRRFEAGSEAYYKSKRKINGK